MTQSRFEELEVHPRVASMLTYKGWLFLHEVKCGYRRMDFLGLDPRNGQLAIIECKTQIASPRAVASQVTDYHELFGIPSAQRWVFSWDVTPQRFIDTFSNKGIGFFHVDNSAALSRVKLKLSDKYKFYENFHRFYPYHDQFPGRAESGRSLHPLLTHYDKVGGLLNIPYSAPHPSTIHDIDYDLED